MVMTARTARTMTATTTPLMIGSGSSNGIAAQLSLPSMSTSRLSYWRRQGRAAGRLVTRRRLLDDTLEEPRRDRAIGDGRHVLAGLCQRGIARIVERRARPACLPDPTLEGLR